MSTEEWRTPARTRDPRSMCPFSVLLPFLVLNISMNGVWLDLHRKAVGEMQASREVTSLGFHTKTLRVHPATASS